MRPWGLIVGGLQAAVALAHASGQTGTSGLTRVTCNDCHGGGAPPSVVVEGPTRVAPGDRVAYTVRSSRSGAVVGVNVAASGGVALSGAAPGLRLEQGELVHDRPLPVEDGGASVQFFVTAGGPGTVTLFASVLAANGDGRVTGDASASARMRIVVDAAVPPPEVPAESPAAPADGPAQARGCAVAPAGAALALVMWWVGRARRRRGSDVLRR